MFSHLSIFANRVFSALVCFALFVTSLAPAGFPVTTRQSDEQILQAGSNSVEPAAVCSPSTIGNDLAGKNALASTYLVPTATKIYLPFLASSPTVRVLVDQNGGELFTPDRKVHITIPAFAVSAPTYISYYANTDVIAAPSTTILKSFDLRAKLADSGELITSFSVPIQIDIQIDDTYPANGQQLGMATWDQRSWKYLPTWVDTQNQLVSAQTFHFSTFGLILTPAADAVQLAPAMPGLPSRGVPYVFFENTITYDYAEGPVALSSTADGTGDLLTDDTVYIRVTRPDGSQDDYYHNYDLNTPPWITSTPPVDVTSLFLPGQNQVYIRLTDLRTPFYWTQGYYLVATSVLSDTLAPVISNVWWRQDGAGKTYVEAIITDNVAVSAAALWWNGQQLPLQLVGPDRYGVVVPKELNGVVGQFRITAVDPSDNIGFWPDDGGTRQERIRYTQWAAQNRNNRSVGEPVNSAIGNFFTHHQDVYAPAPGIPFEFKRTYNSVAATLDGPLGFGWTHNFNIHLQVVDDLLLRGVVVTYEDGRTANFTAEGSGYRSPDGDQNILAHEGGGFVLTRPDQVKYHFDGDGRLISLEDRNHNQLQFGYSGENLTQITDTAGRAYHLTYSGSRITQITDPLGRVHVYTYDAAGNLQMYRTPEGGTIQYTYDGENWLRSIADPNGHAFVSNTYDGRGRVIAQTDASGTPSSIAYLDEFHVVFTDNEGNLTTHSYDERLRIIEETDANGNSILFEYDSDDNVQKITDRGGHTTEFTYDGHGNLLTRTDALNQVAEFRYDIQNNLVYARDEAGAETTYEYDVNGSLAHIHDAGGGDTWLTHDSRGLPLTLRDANSSLTWFNYDAQGNLQTIENALHFITRFEYDAMGRTTAMTDANLHIVRFTYDRNDRVTIITDPKGETTEFVYDGVGNLLAVTDRRGCTTHYEYNENDSLVRVTDPRGYFVAYTYDQMYHRKTLTNGRGFITRYEYDAVYNLKKIIDAKGNPTSFDYDTDGNLIKITDALNQVTQLDYDELHRVTDVTDALTQTTTYRYDPMGRSTWVRDPKGGITSFEYDDLGRLLKRTDALLYPTSFIYDPVGNLKSVTNARGFTTLYAYDPIGQLTGVTDPLNHTLGLTYDGVGNVLTMTDPRGYSTTFTYDANDNLEQATDALDGLLNYTYDEEDNALSKTDQNRHMTAYDYDEVGNVTRITLPMGQVTGMEYDANSNLTTVTNAKSNTMHFAYDALDLLETRTNPLGYPITYGYDELSRLIRVTDAKNNPTQYHYDALNRLTEVVDALDGLTQYEYDPLGNLTAYADANQNRTSFDVDLLGRVLGETNPLGKIWAYGYDPVGNLTHRVDANGVSTQYTFDADDRMTHIKYPTGPGVDFSYDENDNLAGMVDISGGATFDLDPLNRLTGVSYPTGILAGQTLAYAYDPVGNRTQITYPDGKAANYSYNANDWLASVTDPLSGVTNYTYDPVGLPTNIQYPNGTWTEYAYDAADRLVHLYNGKPDASSNLISSFDYTLDRVGNRIHTTERYTRGQVLTWEKEYTYDALYRLTGSTFTPDLKPYQVLTSAYTYDPVGNRLSQTTNIADQPNTPALDPAITTEYTYNDANQLLSTASPLGTTQFAYDNNGNRVSMVSPERAIAYAYTFENQLAGAETYDVQPNGNWHYDSTLDFTYDGLNRRVQRGVIDNGVRKTANFLYDGLGYDLLAQFVDPGSPRTTYYYRDLTQIFSRHEIQGDGSGLQYFHHYDGLGNVSAWTNQSGKETQEYTYAPYGRLIDNNGPDNGSNRTDPHNNLTWSGKPWDKETELYYYGARDYDPTNGVWLTQDPYRGRVAEPMTLQRYMYVNDNPTNWVDLYGFITVNSDGTVTIKGENIPVYIPPVRSYDARDKLIQNTECPANQQCLSIKPAYSTNVKPNTCITAICIKSSSTPNIQPPDDGGWVTINEYQSTYFAYLETLNAFLNGGGDPANNEIDAIGGILEKGQNAVQAYDDYSLNQRIIIQVRVEDSKRMCKQLEKRAVIISTNLSSKSTVYQSGQGSLFDEAVKLPYYTEYKSYLGGVINVVEYREYPTGKFICRFTNCINIVK